MPFSYGFCPFKYGGHRTVWAFGSCLRHDFKALFTNASVGTFSNQLSISSVYTSQPSFAINHIYRIQKSVECGFKLSIADMGDRDYGPCDEKSSKHPV